jgi:4-hydroxy-2-oxoheptanedioate aldolase
MMWESPMRRRSRRAAILAALIASLLLVGTTGAQQASQRLSQPAKLYNTAKQKMLEGKQIFAHLVTKPDAKAYCQAAPHYDYTWFEMQHSTLSYADVEKMTAECPLAGAIPMLRVPDEFESTIQKATDIGMLGIIVPTVDTVEKAMAATKYARYPPVGRRSSGGGQAASIWGVHGINYRDTFNDNLLVVVMIETPVGVANANDIAKVPGVDVVFVGMGDLSQFSGLQQTDARYQQMLADVRDATLKAGKMFGLSVASYASGTRLSKDTRMFYTGPSNDGWKSPFADR